MIKQNYFTVGFILIILLLVTPDVTLLEWYSPFSSVTYETPKQGMTHGEAILSCYKHCLKFASNLDGQENQIKQAESCKNMAAEFFKAIETIDKPSWFTGSSS